MQFVIYFVFFLIAVILVEVISRLKAWIPDIGYPLIIFLFGIASSNAVAYYEHEQAKQAEHSTAIAQ